MTLLQPFCAVMPAADKAALVVSRNYESYSPEELQAVLEYNPYSFLQVINPGYRYHQHLSGAERYTLVRNRYLEFLEENTLVKDTVPAIYIYEMEAEGFHCRGIIATANLHALENGQIKRHEKTLKHKRDLFKEYLNITRIQADPVLLTYKDKPEVTEWIKAQTTAEALEFTTPDKVQHRIRRITEQKRIEELQLAMADTTVYIADGHHRMDSSQAVYKDGNFSDKEPASGVMSLFVAASELRISGFNRVIRDLNGLDPGGFLMALDTDFLVEDTGLDVKFPEHPSEFVMYLDGRFYKLSLRQKHQIPSPSGKLPPEILNKKILKPLLGIKKLRKNKRIHYGSGRDGILKMKRLIDEGSFKVGFYYFPITFDQLTGVADSGIQMPPKSTYIEPKLPSALTLYEF